jgi:hypothetical protein
MKPRALLVIVVLLAGPRCKQTKEFRAELDKVRADTGDVMSSASYQRYQARREAVFAMQEELRSFARAESAFVADSGRPAAFLPPAYGFRKGEGNVGPYIRIEPNGWSAMITNSRTSMRCTLFASLDTVSNTYHPGQPDCRAESGEAWDAVAAAQAARRSPDVPVLDPPAAPAAPPAPRKHRDWGSVNNTPPPIPYIVTSSCQGEGCTSVGTWAACDRVVARNDKKQDARPVFTIQPGERFTALNADVHVDVPGMVVFRRAFSTSLYEGDTPVDLTFTPGDTLFVLNYIGEGARMWWFRGHPIEAFAFWDDDPEEPLARNPADSVALVRRTQTVWWVHVRNAAGKEGWIVGDYSKMATGGYMDEIERCLH